MRNIIEDTLVSLDGVYAGAAISRFSEYRRDEAYGPIFDNLRSFSLDKKTLLY